MYNINCVIIKCTILSLLYYAMDYAMPLIISGTIPRTIHNFTIQWIILYDGLYYTLDHDIGWIIPLDGLYYVKDYTMCNTSYYSQICYT